MVSCPAFPVSLFQYIDRSQVIGSVAATLVEKSREPISSRALMVCLEPAATVKGFMGIGPPVVRKLTFTVVGLVDGFWISMKVSKPQFCLLYTSPSPRD